MTIICKEPNLIRPFLDLGPVRPPRRECEAETTLRQRTCENGPQIAQESLSGARPPASEHETNERTKKQAAASTPSSPDPAARPSLRVIEVKVEGNLDDQVRSTARSLTKTVAARVSKNSGQRRAVGVRRWTSARSHTVVATSLRGRVALTHRYAIALCISSPAAFATPIDPVLPAADAPTTPCSEVCGEGNASYAMPAPQAVPAPCSEVCADGAASYHSPGASTLPSTRPVAVGGNGRDGFDWGDAGIGGATTIVLLGLGVGGARAVIVTRPREAVGG
jgi:hypothetical protein